MLQRRWGARFVLYLIIWLMVQVEVDYAVPAESTFGTNPQQRHQQGLKTF